MAYGARLKAYFKDVYNRYTWQINVKQKDYSGTETDVDYTAPNPLEINFADPTRWPLEPVVQSDTLFSIWSNTRFEFADLVDVDATKNRVEITRNGNTYWKGYIVTDLYEEPLELIKEPLTFAAADFSILENYNITLIGMNSPQAYVFHILNKLNFEFSFRVAIATTGFLSVTAFKSLTLNAETFKSLNALEALQKIMVAYGAQCYQKNGVWHIIQVAEKSKNITYTDYNSSGTQTSTGTYNNTIATNANYDLRTDFCKLLPGGGIQKLPPLKEFTIRTKLQKRENFIKNGDFSEYTDYSMLLGTTNYNFDYWSETTDILPKTIGETPAALVPLGKYMEQEIEALFVHDTTKQFLFTFKYAFATSATNAADQTATADLWVKITVGSFYLNGKGEWQTTDTKIRLENNADVQGYNNLTFKEFNLRAFILPGIVKIQLLGPTNIGDTDNIPADEIQYDGTLFSDVSITVVSTEDTPEIKEEIKTTHSINELNNYTPDDIELLFDLPPADILNPYYIYNNVAFPESQLTYNGKTGTLAQLLANQVKDMLSNPPKLIRATIESDLFSIDNMLTDEEFSPSRFMPVSAKFKPLRLTWELNLININTEEEITPDFYAPDFDGSDFFTGE